MSLQDHIYNANQIIQNPPPPSLRDILTAYRTKGDGDREMLLAMLGAKAAEDNRLAQTASLQRSLLDTCNQSLTLPPPPPPPPAADTYYHHHHSSRKRHRSSHSPYARHLPLSPRSEDAGRCSLSPPRVLPRTSSTRQSPPPPDS
ncbi:hypothetical protein E1B28_001352 [Marasmius oreades]|uniref:Uncharacterized protein n=1 Tax=Marasmius oreades TaxID=181124 RepID=A0A9P8AF30_9AGAR|nr:uncharacterized protein E1B28_001352 [Marasmius oreades]KAG7099506.1 hypothetical protein E1B28_001352 [Marasmius oreades]